MFQNLSLEEPLLIGISGGADSVALLHLLLENGYRNLILCHFNHQLRGADSDDDATFVKNLATSLQLPFELGTEDVQALATREKLSLEAAAREARYEFFAAVAQKRNVKKLLLAHHADDQVETCFLHFLRGTGSAGLAGMLPVSQRTIDGVDLEIARPLLAISKKELISFLTSHQLTWREDDSNKSHLPTRNRLRNRVLPLLDELIGPSYRNAITRTATILAAEDEYLESLAAPQAQQAELKTQELAAMPLALQRRVVHAWLRTHGFSEVSFVEVERVLSLLNLDGPAKVNLRGDAHARRRSGIIFLEYPDERVV
ncbi:MAG: tRNA lysidine(34) synthetase TilS [Verrucomicrobiae bacterium]|nr:tRNA lysidine(34) synthetase TilS [Verrucomicrobiae bacterium]